MAALSPEIIRFFFDFLDGSVIQRVLMDRIEHNFMCVAAKNFVTTDFWIFHRQCQNIDF